jgi:hypothetical protein
MAARRLYWEWSVWRGTPTAHHRGSSRPPRCIILHLRGRRGPQSPRLDRGTIPLRCPPRQIVSTAENAERRSVHAAMGADRANIPHVAAAARSAQFPPPLRGRARVGGTCRSHALGLTRRLRDRSEPARPEVRQQHQQRFEKLRDRPRQRPRRPLPRRLHGERRAQFSYRVAEGGAGRGLRRDGCHFHSHISYRPGVVKDFFPHLP